MDRLANQLAINFIVLLTLGKRFFMFVFMLACVFGGLNLLIYAWWNALWYTTDRKTVLKRRYIAIAGGLLLVVAAGLFFFVL